MAAANSAISASLIIEAIAQISLKGTLDIMMIWFLEAQFIKNAKELDLR